MTPELRNMITGNTRHAAGTGAGAGAEQSVSAAYARGLVDLAVKKGADQQALLMQSRIESEELLDPDARIPLERYIELMRAARASSGDDALALHYGEATDISSVSVIGLIGQAAGTMMDALVQLNRYVRLVVDVNLTGGQRFELDHNRDGLWLVDTRKHPNRFPELTESAFAQLITGPRHLGVPAFARTVHVTHPAPAYAAEYQRIFQTPVTFQSDRNAIRIDPAVMTQRVARLPEYAFGVLTGHADALLGTLDGPETTRSAVEQLLIRGLPAGNIQMRDVADQLSVSRQTLYRRLRAEGVTFDHVLDDLRLRLAREYLGPGNLSVNETAYLLGFSDPAAFSRAFKRWTGSSPRDARTTGLQRKQP